MYHPPQTKNFHFFILLLTLPLRFDGCNAFEFQPARLLLLLEFHMQQRGVAADPQRLRVDPGTLDRFAVRPLRREMESCPDGRIEAEKIRFAVGQPLPPRPGG